MVTKKAGALSSEDLLERFRPVLEVVMVVDLVVEVCAEGVVVAVEAVLLVLAAKKGNN